jgi:hypothetical protein
VPVAVTVEQEKLLAPPNNEEKDKKVVAVAVEEQTGTENALLVYRSCTYIIFHFIMVVLSVYGVMLLTNWGDPDFDNAITFNIRKPSIASYWINISVAWATALLYIWTLIAPRLFPDRVYA